MRIVVFGLSVSSSWGNGHATLWRALGRALAARGHTFVFYEQDVPYYAAHRDGVSFPGVDLRLYADLADLRRRAAAELAGADAAIVTSFCPSGGEVAEMVLASRADVRVFYDLDTPVTFAKLDAGVAVDYLPAGGLAGFDLVLSFAGGRALTELRRRLGAEHVVPLYGFVDPDVHRPAAPRAAYRGDLSYIGTYAEDRQVALTELLLEPARRAPHRRFPVAGALYPEGLHWPANVAYLRHLGVADHPAFFASSPFTLNVTRAPMAAMGHCPSGRLFEAAACGAVVITDAWPGIEQFYEPGREIVVADRADDVLAALALDNSAIATIARRARERTLAEHTAARRAGELEAALGWTSAATMAKGA